MKTSSQLPGTTHVLQKLDARLLQVPGGNASDIDTRTEICMWEAQAHGTSFAASQASRTVDRN